MRDPIGEGRRGAIPPPAYGILVSAYGVLLATLLLGALQRDTPLLSILLPIAAIIGLGQYPSG